MLSVKGESGKKERDGLEVSEIRPDGIVCLDVKDPLEQLSTADLVEIGEVLGLSFGTEVACLWRLRK